MQLARINRLGDKSSREIGKEKALQVLHWVYRWGWTSPTTAGVVGNDNQNGLAARLVRRGFLNKTRTESGGGERGVPTYILTLTQLGIQEVERSFKDDQDLRPYNIDPFRVNQALLRHDHMAQSATATALKKKDIFHYESPSELGQRSADGIKQPDVIWFGENLKMGIEVELTGKWGRELDQFVRGCLIALVSPNNGAPSRFTQIGIVSDAPAILNRYKKAFLPGARYSVWERDEHSRHWKKVSDSVVPSWIKGKIVWKLIGER